MKRYTLLVCVILLTLVAAVGCDSAATADTVVDSMTVPDLPEDEALDDVEEASTEPVGRAAVPSVDVSVAPVMTPEPVFENSAEGEIVAIQTATPAPEQDPFSYENNDEITVQYFDLVTEQTQETHYPVTDASDPLTVVEGVTSTLDDVLGGQHIEVSSTNYSNGNLFVDFDPSIYSLGLSSGDEDQVLNSIADTYLSNVQGIKAVYYTVGGEPYQSDHIQLLPGEAFKTAN